MYLFKKGRDDTDYYIKMDITGSIGSIKDDVLDGKTVSTVVRSGCKRCVGNSGGYSRQAVSS